MHEDYYEIEGINRDSDDQRKKITLSKFKTYNTLEICPDPNTDFNFLDIIGSPITDNDLIDAFLLYAVYRNAVNFLITEDLGIHRKSNLKKLFLTLNPLNHFAMLMILRMLKA